MKLGKLNPSAFGVNSASQAPEPVCSALANLKPKYLSLAKLGFYKISSQTNTEYTLHRN